MNSNDTEPGRAQSPWSYAISATAIIIVLVGMDLLTGHGGHSFWFLLALAIVFVGGGFAVLWMRQRHRH